MQKYYLCKSINKSEYINQNNCNLFLQQSFKYQALSYERELLKYYSELPSTGKFQQLLLYKKNEENFLIFTTCFKNLLTCLKETFNPL